MSMKSSKNAVPSLLTSLAEITQVENDPVLGDRLVPSSDEVFVHLSDIREAGTMPKDLLVGEMRVRCEVHLLGSQDG